MARGRSGWWQALAVAHRWLGIAGCLLILLWFISGIAMMYVRMPEVTADERYDHLAFLNPSTINTPLADAARAAGVSPNSIQLVILGTRPLYRFNGRTPVAVFADDGTRLEWLDQADAMRLAQAFAPHAAATLHYLELMSWIPLAARSR